MTLPLILLFCGAALALGYAFLRSRWIFNQPVESDLLRKIGGYVADGAMAFLSREYRVLIPFVLVVTGLLCLGNQGHLRWQSLSFLLGASCSALAGFIGMKVATAANMRTTHAAKTGLNEALRVAFTGGSVMGMSVVGLAMLGIAIVMAVGCKMIGADAETLRISVLPIVSGFSLGASSIALFARVGGGIYTKAADVGADLVGKVEAGIPEDDPRNPATIADNVGDNVGDVAGMGADLFESYVGCLIGCMILGLAVDGSTDVQKNLLVLPLVLSVLGLVASIIGVFFVRAKPGRSPQGALNAGSTVAALITAIGTYPICRSVLGDGMIAGTIGSGRIFLASVTGLVAGLAIASLTEFFTGTGKKPVNIIVKACETGAATNLITGMGIGMLSTLFPVMVICAAMLTTFSLAGMYGIAIAALGMLLTLGIQLAVDAYGPIADNAGGLAEMSQFPPEVRKITDELDAVGNTTAAIGKGFAIGSAALTAIILFSAFRETVGVSSIELTDPKVMVGILLGAAVPYLFSSLAMMAVGRAAFAMIEEVRRQFRTIPGLLENKAEPDYAKCVDISTTAALKEMMLPGLLAALTPVVVGFAGGVGMLAGLLTGVTASGVVLAIFMSNTGGAWDNAKKMIEDGAAGGKGSEAHTAAVVGDTVGDPFKDTAGPSLNILIKLMAVVSLVIAPMLKIYFDL
ncbi:MAG: sodium-translocating pyrophosphatase [Kiritimatiellae bacterium]|nr:sodium-translocating pyrophosphatase [Kiritimatiellia bacterium]